MTNNYQNMLRFYYRFCNYAGKYEIVNPLPNRTTKSFTAESLDYPSTQFVELHVDAHTFEVKEIIPMDVTFIMGGAIKAANDHNNSIVAGPKNEVTEKHARDYKPHAQKLVDRLLVYGDEFETLFNELIVKFPIPPTVVPEGTKILG